MATRSRAKSGARRTRRKDPKGGLTAEGRRYFARREGAHLRPGVRGPADTPEKMRRKGSFLRRHFAHPRGPMLDEHGAPTRLALSAHAWGEPVPRTMAAARRLAEKGARLLARYAREKEKPMAARKTTKKRAANKGLAKKRAPAKKRPAKKRAPAKKRPAKKRPAKKRPAKKRAPAKKSPAKKRAAPRKKAAGKATTSRTGGAKNSLVANINRRKKAGTSRPRSQSTVSKNAYRAMQHDWR